VFELLFQLVVQVRLIPPGHFHRRRVFNDPTHWLLSLNRNRRGRGGAEIAECVYFELPTDGKHDKTVKINPPSNGTPP
jgi:hypothetical protein